MGLRTEVAISLTIAWNPTTMLEPRDVPTVRNFLAAVKGMLRLPGNGLRLTGPVTMLEAAFETALPATEILPESASPVMTFAEGERALLRNALIASRGHQAQAAARLGVRRETIGRLMRKHGLTAESPPCTPGPRPRALELVS